MTHSSVLWADVHHPDDGLHCCTPLAPESLAAGAAATPGDALATSTTETHCSEPATAAMLVVTYRLTVLPQQPLTLFVRRVIYIFNKIRSDPPTRLMFSVPSKNFSLPHRCPHSVRDSNVWPHIYNSGSLGQWGILYHWSDWSWYTIFILYS